MNTLVTIISLYLAIGGVVGLMALFRSRRSPFDLLEGLNPLKTAAAAVVLWPVVVLNEQQLGRARRRLSAESVRTDWVVTEFKIPESWIKGRVARRPRDFDWAAAGLTPETNPGVQDLLDMMVVGDELWKFSSDTQSWQRLAGRSGYVLLRKGQQVAQLTTTLN